MQLRQRCVDVAQQLRVVAALQVARQAALDAQLGGAEKRGVPRFGDQCLGGMEIGVLRLGPAREAAKSAADKANIGEVEVAVHHIGDGLADGAAAQLVRGLDQSDKITALYGA